MLWLKWLGLSMGILLVAGTGAVAYGAWRWGESTKALLARLEAARIPLSVERYGTQELDGLPAPVQRYFRAALKDGQPMITAGRVEHSGTFNMGEKADQWKPFTSKQRVIMSRPGFNWDARIMMFPGVPVHVHDAYIAGVGILRGAVFRLIPVVNMPDTPELARGELMRFFAEAAWLLPQGAKPYWRGTTTSVAFEFAK